MRYLLVLPILLGACSFSPSADVIKALAGDPNTLYVSVTTPWGGMIIDRNHGGPNNQASQGPVIVMPGNQPLQVIRP